MSRDGFKMFVPHSRECWFADSEDAAPFVLHDGIEWSRRKNGAKGGSFAFHRFRCNCTKCPAILLVRIDVLADWLGNP